MQVQGQIPRRMGEIECNSASLVLPCLGDSLHVKSLAGRVVHASEKDEGDGAAFALDQLFNILLADADFIPTRREFEERGRRIKSMETNLRFDRILVGGKRSMLDQNFVSLRCGAIKRHH